MRASELKTTEYAPFYATYIAKVGDAELLPILETGKQATVKLFESIAEDKHEYRYASNKWTIKEVLQHIIDTERIFAYRALRIGRGDRSPIAGFDQNDYSTNALANRRSLSDLLTEYKAVRQSTQIFLQSMNDDMLVAEGTASGFNVSVRALGFMIAGHEKHHLGIVEEKYLS